MYEVLQQKLWLRPRALAKLLLIMRLTTLILISAILQVSASTYAQKISLSEQNVSLTTVLNRIKMQTGYDFFYKSVNIKSLKNISIQAKNEELKDVLIRILQPQYLDFEIDDNSVIIKTKQPSFLEQVISRLQDIDIRGHIVSALGNPLSGANIRVKGTTKGTTTNSNGEFYLTGIDENAMLQIAYVGYETKEIKVSKDLGTIVLQIGASSLTEVSIVSTGYQTLPKERATGSFDQIDNKLLNRSVSTDILSRINGVSSGVYFPTNKIGGNSETGGDPGISIRGRSTLFANTEPLIVLDNFPYDGDLNNINPNDVESVTVLKDAAAASIWGVKAGNGVIVITTKKGRFSQSPKVSFNSNVTVAEKPDVFALPQLSSADAVDVQTYLYNQGKYTTQLAANPSFVLQSPVVEILNSQLSADAKTAQLNTLRNSDVRNDLMKYYYQHAVLEQYALNINGGTLNNQYNFSIGYDHNKNGTAGSAFSRVTLNGGNTYQLMDKKLEISTGILLTLSKTSANTAFSPSMLIFPYQMLADADGTALTVFQSFRESTKANLYPGKLLDWTFKPLNELSSNQKNNLTDTRLNISASYKILNGLKFGIYYMYQKGLTDQVADFSLSSYYARNQINTYTQVASTGVVTNNIPVGAIDRFNNTRYETHNGRAQFSYEQTFAEKHHISGIGGFELKNNTTLNSFYSIYGFNSETGKGMTVDFTRNFPAILGGAQAAIGGYPSQQTSIDRYLSYYANVAYNYNGRYTLSASARRDESNLFGVASNQKGVPLWSAGISWNVNKESFYQAEWLPLLKIRLTDGYSGNISKSLSAYTTAQNIGNNSYGVPQLSIINPPNPDLRWEKVHITNAGIDFGTKNNRLSGSIEAYIKKGSDLIGSSPIAPQTGIVVFTGNNSDVKTRGVDFTLNSINVQGALNWSTNFLFSYVADKVTNYQLLKGSNSSVVSSNYSNPIVGKPYSAVFAYRWGGLDATGNPQGYLNGVLSKDYSAMQSSTDVNQLVYMGQASPKNFGSLRNNLAYKGVELSANIIYKFGYVFRRGVLNNTGLYSTGSAYQFPDYDKRWQKPGDELTTNVPALIYPANSTLDNFYTYTEVAIERGDHIRLQDIQLSYNLSSGLLRRLPFTAFKIYGYVNNVGILWRANKAGLDPDNVTGGLYTLPNPRTYAIGINANFK